MSESRRYVSPKREAQAAATREAILEAFAEQLMSDDRTTLSPSDAAQRAGVSVRTVHAHFPTADDQIVAVGEWFDRTFYREPVRPADGPSDLARYFHDIHDGAYHPMTRVLSRSHSPAVREVRGRRRAARLDAVRRAVAAIGAPDDLTEDATAVLLGLSGADVGWVMHEHGLPLERIPGAIARTVQVVVDDLTTAAAAAKGRRASRR